MSFARSLKAVLGPTNTGKTWFAIERMLAHPSGMIGLPLRLLAREVYQKVRDRVGDGAVALVTGEERIVPPHPRYWVATVEAMPDVAVDMVAIDEIQTAISFDRGHVFTNRLLSARGRQETLLLGAETMVPAIRALLPDAEIVHRPRLSQLTYAGSRKISRQPERSAIVAFSATQVYAIAELLRRERGGGRRGDGRALPAHPQRPGGTLPVRRGRLPRRHRRHRHGAEPRRAPRRLRRRHQVRRAPDPSADPRRVRPDRRARRTAPAQRHLRRDGGRGRVRARIGRTTRGPRFRADPHPAMAQHCARLRLDRGAAP